MNGQIYGLTVLDDNAFETLVKQEQDLSAKLAQLQLEIPDMFESDKWDDQKRADYSVKALMHRTTTDQVTLARQQIRDQVQLRDAAQRKDDHRKGRVQGQGLLSRYLMCRDDSDVREMIGAFPDEADKNNFVIQPPRLANEPSIRSDTTTDGGQRNAIVETLAPGVVERLAYEGGVQHMAYTFMTDDGTPRGFVGLDDSTSAGELWNAGNPQGLDLSRQITEANNLVGSFPAASKVTFNAYTIWTKPIWESLNAFEDVAYLNDEFISAKLYNRLARGANIQYTNGTGANAPTGVVTKAAAGLTTATTGVITYTELINLCYKVNRAYRMSDSGLIGPGAGPDVRMGGRIGWMMSDDCERYIRTMVDGDGRPIWTVNTDIGALTNTTPNMLLGMPYVVNERMDDVATTNVPLLMGNFSYFGIRTVGRIWVRRFYDSLTALNDNNMFIGRMRVDSKPIGALTSGGDLETVVKLTIK